MNVILVWIAADIAEKGNLIGRVKTDRNAYEAISTLRKIKSEFSWAFFAGIADFGQHANKLGNKELLHD